MRIPVIAMLTIAFFATAATCVSDVRQHSPSGPWTGDVVNTRDYAVFGVSARAQITDERGRDFYGEKQHALACPSTLLPGERGAFSMTVGEDDEIEGAPEFPLHARFDPVAFDFPGHSDGRSAGLLVTELSRTAGGRGVNVRVTNNSGHGYTGIRACGVQRAAGGSVESVGDGISPNINARLAPGGSVDFSVNFDLSLSDASSGSALRFYAEGLSEAPAPACCPAAFASNWHSVDLGEFSVLLPPDWQYVPAQGIDSYVGNFVGPHATLSFDYGAYSNTLPYEQDSRYAVHFETIGGLTAKVVEPTGTSGVTGVHIDNLGVNVIGDISLTVAGNDLSATDEEIALQIFRSIRVD